MAMTWFFAKVDPEHPLRGIFKEAMDEVPEWAEGHYELYREGEYEGWVKITSDGTIEFGSPGV